MSNLFDFRSVEQLHEFVGEIRRLRELVKCPVCLEVTKDPVRIACDHLFCSRCLDTFINTFKDQAPNKVPYCPICRKAINGRRNPANGYVESLLVFLGDVDAGMRSTFSCDILALSNEKNIDKLFKQKLSEDVPSSVIESTSSQENAFDKLLNSELENPPFKGKYGKTYAKNATNKKAPVKVFDKLKAFENKDTKTKIHEWLEDTKNRFDRLTQTQCTTPKDVAETQMSVNMPSVSQINDRQTRQKTGLAKRPKSFELKPKVPIVRLRRYSITECSQGAVGGVQIEEIESEDANEDVNVPNKEQMLRLLEEECLNSIDLELGVDKLNEEPKLKEQKPTTSNDKKNGFKRMKKINNAIIRNSRRKKTLNVTRTSPPEKENILTKNTTDKQKSPPIDKENVPRNPFVILKRFGSNVEYSNVKGKMAKTIPKTKPNAENSKEKNESSMEINEQVESNNEKSKKIAKDNEDFICSATKLSTKKHKLAVTTLFSDDQCSMQCSKNNSHENCSVSNVNIHKLNTNIVDDAAQVLEKLKTSLKNNDDLDSASLEKLKTVLTDVNNVLCKNELSNENKNKTITTSASTQTIYFDTKSVSVQTETVKNTQIEKKEFRSIDLQTDDLASCATCSKSKDVQLQESQNSDLTPSDILLNTEQMRQFSEQMELDDDLGVKTQKITGENKEKTARSPLLPTQKIDNDNEEHDKLENIKESQKVIEEVPNSKDIIANSKRSGLNSQLMFSLSNHRINSTEECEERIAQVSKRYKRIRTLDLDSDEEGLAKKTKVENKYLADNLSIQMISENIVDECDSDIKQTNDSNLSLNKDVDYDTYLVNIMKKYEDNSSADKCTSKTNNQNKPSSSKKTDSQTVFDRCDAMIKEITSIKHVNKTLNDPGETSETKPPENEVEVNIADITVRESPIDLEVMEEFDKPFHQNSPPSTCNKNSGVSPCTESFMANINIDELESNSDLNRTVKYIPMERKSEEHANVIILNDILFDPRDAIVRKRQGKDDEDSEDLFNSENDDPIDEDMIDATPKKQSQVVQRSSSHLKSKSLLNELLPLPPAVDSPDIISSIDPTSFLDLTFTPPADFQDANNDENNKNATNCDVVNVKVTTDEDVMNKTKNNRSLISLDLINPKDFDDTMFASDASLERTMLQSKAAKEKKDKDKIDLSLTESEVMRLINTGESSYVVTSTQKGFANENVELLGISPIRKEKRKKNPIEIAQSARFSPLNVISVTKPESPKSRFVSSLTAKQRSILSFVKSDKIDKNESIISIGSSDLSPSPAKKPCVSCTRLNKDQMLAVSTLTRRKLIHYTNMFSPQVTHVIVSANKRNCLPDHTMKILMAIAYKKWILSFDWIKDCLTYDRILPEEKYEVFDMSGLPGPKTSRLKRNEKPLLQGYQIHLEPPFSSVDEQDLKELIRVLGGEIVPNIESLAKLKGVQLIISEAKSSQDYYKCEKWLQTYKVVSVDVEWLSRSIGQYKLVSLKPFTLCSDDNINSLGYPPELTIEISLSYSQNV